MNLSKQLVEKLQYIEQHSRNLWSDHISLYFFTPHDPSHSEGVINNIKRLVLSPEIIRLKNFLNEQEVFYLYCAAWLHDIGMIPDLFEDEPKSKKINRERYLQVRAEHHLRSKQYIEQNYRKLGLTDKDASIIGELCRLHRRRERIETNLNLRTIRVSLLGAYLRIADALHVDSSRVDEFKGLYNLFLAQGMQLSSEFHWLRSIWIEEVRIDHENATIIIVFNLSEKEEYVDIEYLKQVTINDIKEELASCNNVLLNGRLSFFTDVICEFNECPISDENKAKLKQIISKLKMQNTASSSQVADIMMDTIGYIAEYYNDNSQDTLTMIEDYTNSEVGDLKKDRPCHVLVKYVESFVRDSILQNIPDQDKIKNILEKISTIKAARKKNIEIISNDAKSLLSSCSPILLFGYSSIVIKIFEKIVDESIKENTPIYVLECRSKNQLNFKNDIIYCDGFRYAKHLKLTGFKKIWLVPDIISGNLIGKGKVQKIFFGANTVDIDKEEIGHTAGHNTIIHSAIENDVPIYVFADSYKFGDLPKAKEDKRETDWFTGDLRLKQEIDESGIQFYNPRSDVIEMKYVHEFYTDCGNFPPTQIPQKLKDKVREIKKYVAYIENNT